MDLYLAWFASALLAAIFCSVLLPVWYTMWLVWKKVGWAMWGPYRLWRTVRAKGWETAAEEDYAMAPQLFWGFFGGDDVGCVRVLSDWETRIKTP